MNYILVITLFLITTAFGITTFVLCLDILTKEMRVSKKLLSFLIFGITKASVWLILVEKTVDKLLLVGLLIELFLLLSLAIYLLLVSKLTKGKRE